MAPLKKLPPIPSVGTLTTRSSAATSPAVSILDPSKNDTPLTVDSDLFQPIEFQSMVAERQLRGIRDSFEAIHHVSEPPSGYRSHVC